MVRPRIDLDQYRSFIIDQYQQNISLVQILKTLKDEYNCFITDKTLSRRLRQWNIPIRQTRTIDDDQLRDRIKEIYFTVGLSDQDMVQQLRREGFQISLRGVRRLRKSVGIFRRLDYNKLNRVTDDLRQFFETERTTDNIVHMMGKSSLYVHVRQQQYSIPRDHLWKIYAEFHQPSIDYRLAKLHRRRGGWTCPGPNYIWSIDGYCKLQRFGIEVYAGIDAYSRMITWFYVGVSANTARSVFAQYINVIGQYNYIPLLIRADRGKETGLIAGAHFWLSSAVRTAGRSVPGSTNQDIPGLNNITE